jgi:hypothetical protein
MSPARVVYVVQILRNAMLAMHIKGLSMKERASKMGRLYNLITSESYAGKFAEATNLSKDILDLDVQEQTAHNNVWKKRGSMMRRMQNVLREVETEVAAVIESDESLDGTTTGKIPGSSNSGALQPALVKEKAAWAKN